MITPERAPARTVAIKEDERSVVLARYGGVAMLPAAIVPHAFITLATPHLGIRYLFGSPRLRKFGAFFAPSASELNLTDGDTTCLVARMAGEGGAHTEALKRFALRVALAPLIDDGVVAYPSAALTGRCDVPSDADGGAVIKE